MSAMRDQIAERSRTLLIVLTYAGTVGALSVVLNIGDAAGGEIPAIGRSLLGLVGVVAAALLWTRPRLGGSLRWSGQPCRSRTLPGASSRVAPACP